MDEIAPAWRKRCASCAVACLFGWVSGVQAQSGGAAMAQADAAAPASAASRASTPSPTPAPAVTELPPIEVVGTAPLLGIGTPLAQVPANVQTFHARDIERQHSNTLTGFLADNVSSLDLNSAQGNPYQADVIYRGFTASPLLGTPQGLSVFLDGVRINEPFGDVVNWDLIPQAAIDQIQVIPGSNPVFGLNTLGGALAVSTKDGKQYPGGAIETSIGSFGRKTVELEQGGTIGDRLDYFVTGTAANDNGWADHNSSKIRQLFGKLRYTDSDTTLRLSFGTADNTLNGSQTIPRSFLDNFRQAYTFPDLNQNHATFFTFSGDHYFTDDIQLSGNVYYRKYRNDNTSSNVNGDFGTVGADGTVDLVQATNDRSVVNQDSYGTSVQLTLLGKLGGLRNQFVAGVAADFARTRFTQYSQDAEFTASRDTIGLDDYALSTDAKTRNDTYGVYFENTLSLSPHWSVVLAGRYNWSEAVIADQTGVQPLLNGNNTFSRFNPAIGINWNPTNAFTAYATYNEGMRAPTAIELACADPNAPCSLPNNFISDPALKPVVSRTYEIGARGRLNANTNWSAAVYRTTLDNDIQFISSNGGTNTTGFFSNVGKTRRQGFELAGRTKLAPFVIAASYSYVDATYQSTWVENSSSNSSADANGNITVKPGDKIPGIPQNTVKLRLEYDVSAKWDIGTNITYRSSIFARGDENNSDVNGKVAGYVVVNLDTTYQVTKQLQVFARIDNVFDKRYADFATIGQNFFTGAGHTFDGANPANEQFLGLGAPRGFWAGLRYAWR
jgi:outer membrane receptor protein involved in Fe transport